MIDDKARPPAAGPHRGDERGLSDHDRALWRRAMGDVRRLRGGPPAPGPPAPDPASSEATARGEKAPLPPAAARPRPAAALPVLETGAAPGLDRRTLTRLKRGLIAPEATIDLHRLTQAEAHRELDRFLAAAREAGRRCVLVVTGKGYGSQTPIGVLKAMVPRWLNETPNRERVLAFCHARTRDGGDGALYVLLRRRRARDADPRAKG